MKGTRHSEEQIIAILKQGEAGLATCTQVVKSDRWVLGEAFFQIIRERLRSRRIARARQCKSCAIFDFPVV
jgi:hypothetical protein